MMEKPNVFQLSFIGLIIVNFLNIAEQSFCGITEWIHLLILKFHRNYDIFQGFNLNDGTIMLILLAFLIILIIVGTLVFLEIRWSTDLAVIIAIFDFFYGIAHVIAGIYFRAYFPGAITAILLIMVGFLVLYFYYLMKHPLKKEGEEETEIKQFT